MYPDNIAPQTGPFRTRLHEIIFEADSPAGRLFDILLIVLILASIIVVMLDSVKVIHIRYGLALTVAEWLFTLLFTLEYGLRIYCLKHPRHYVLSFYGLVDLVAVLPAYLSLLFPGSQYLLVVRALRLLRIFRILKLAQFLNEGEYLLKALKNSSRKILVFLFFIMTVVLICGSLLYLIEGDESGFTSIGVSC